MENKVSDQSDDDNLKKKDDQEKVVLVGLQPEDKDLELEELKMEINKDE